MSEWQPIVTAPKDQIIDLWVAHPSLKGDEGMRITDAKWFDARWIYGDGDNVEYHDRRATHWAPLPKAPEC